MAIITPEICKLTCLSTIEHYLQMNKIKYTRIESKSGSIYFTLNLYNGEPRIRVSDHAFHKDEDYKLCSLSINYVTDFGRHSTPKKIKVRVQNMLNKLIKSHTTYHIHKVFKSLDEEKKS